MKILFKHERSVPNPNKPYIKNGKEIIWDNINLYIADLDRYGRGLIIPSDRTKLITKIKSDEFEKVTGFTYEEFSELFDANFFGHEIFVLGNNDAYDNFIPRIVNIEEVCYISYTPEALKYFEENRNRRDSSEDGDLIPF